MSVDKKPKQQDPSIVADDALPYEQVPLDSVRRPRQDPQTVIMPQLSYSTRTTLAWGLKKTAALSGVHPHTKTISPVKTSTDLLPFTEEEAETGRNAQIMSDRISEIPRQSLLPDLHQLLETVPDPNGFVDESPAFQILEASRQDVTTTIPAPPETIIAITESEEPPKPTTGWPEYSNENANAPVIDSLKPVARPQPSIQPEGKPWTENIRETAKATLAGLASVTQSIGGFFRRHAKAAILATGLAATATAGMLIKDSADQADNSQKQPTQQTVDTPAPQPTVVVTPRVDQKVEIQTPEKSPENRNFAQVLRESKSPVVQDIINKGETRLAGNTVTDTMIASFRGLATNKQILELDGLQRSINLGISVYFNEHFGTAEKVTQSLKDPKLRNLYRTALAEQKNGRVLPYLTKDRFPQEYQLSARILADGSELGLDQSTSSNARARELVSGNMFQAKAPGDVLKLRKQDGSYHVILEVVFGILEGKNTKQLLGEKLAVKHAENSNQIRTGAVIDRSGDNGSGGVEAPAHDQGTDTGKGQTGQNTIDNGTPTGVASVAPITDDVDAGWDNIISEHENLALERAALQKNHALKFELNCGYTSKEEKAAVVPQVAEKIAALYPSADKSKIQGLVRRYGYIGFSSVKQESRTVEVTLNKNFHRILEEVLSA